MIADRTDALPMSAAAQVVAGLLAAPAGWIYYARRRQALLIRLASIRSRGNIPTNGIAHMAVRRRQLACGSQRSSGSKS